MKSRRVIALTAFLTFFVMLVSSVVLYIAPQGRIAYWANWALGGLSKGQWTDIHINTGIVFLLTLLCHLYFNWKAIKTYLKTRDRKLKILTKEFSVAVLITSVCIAGTYMKLPPFSSMLALSEVFKDVAAETYGEPPYGHAEESTLLAYCKKMGLDITVSTEKLLAVGYRIPNGDIKIKDLARQNKVSPQKLLLPLIPQKSFSNTSSTETLPIPDELSGVGRLTLEDLNKQYNSDKNKIIVTLQARGITLDDSTKLKEVAEQQSISAHDLFDIIREINNNNL